ncbi:MAG: two-component regulator propeller domain-containing protein, partial [Cyclobacteriaceae bacterium]
MRKYVFILILCSAYNIFGQASKRFYAIGTADGLSSGSITSVVQDKTGFIWIGTKNGLNRYDGHDFITYNTSNSALSSNDISSLFIDSSQRFWLGTTGGGLYILDNEQINTSGTDFSSIGQIIIQISEPIPGVIMVVSERGLFKISTKNDSSFEFVKVLDKSWFPHYLEYAHHSYWLGSQQGELFQFNESFELLETYSITNDKSIGNIIFDIYSVTQDSILVGTKNDGLLLLDRVQKTFNSAGIEKTIVRDIYLDSDGILWIATDGKGLYSGGLQNGFQRHEHISGSNISIVSNAIYKIFEDNMRNLWLGTAWNGISVIDQKTKEYDFYYSDFLGEEASGVLSIFAKQNRLFFGADGSGLHAYQNKSNLKIPRDSYVQMIKELDDDFYWIGTFNNGLYRVNDNRTYNYQVRSNDHSISYNDVRDVVALGDKKYLVATWGGGLNWFDAEKEIFNTLSNADSLQPDPINVVKLEELGVKIWVSTFGEGLFSFHKLSGELKRALIEPKNIVSLEALESTLYIGTWDKGLFAMDTSTLQVTQVTNAVLSNNETIVSLLNDENGGLWIATKTGIFHKDPSGNIQQIPQLKGEYHINANTRDEEGTFYFGNTAGVVSFQMSILDQQVDTLNIEMLGVSLFNQEIDHTSELWSGEDLLLAHDQNTLTFDYAGLSFPASAAINYELKLTPLHSDWIQMGAQRSVTFANLTDGAYQLEIRSK